MTLREALNQATARLQDVGIERARFEARLLMAHALGVRIEDIIADDDWELVAEQVVEIDVLINRRVAREPMSQILGWREFFGRRFAVSAEVLTPRPDSETLIEAVLDHFTDRAAALRVLDLGTGSGCLLLTVLAEYPNAFGIGLDRSEAALSIARSNAQDLDRSGQRAGGGQMLAGRWQMLAGSWSNKSWSASLGRFDLVLANPPYIPSGDLPGLDPEVRNHEPRLALDGGPDGLAAYRMLAAALPGLLTPGGLAAFEVGAGQAKAVAELLRQAGLKVLPPRNDLAGVPRCVLAAPL